MNSSRLIYIITIDCAVLIQETVEVVALSVLFELVSDIWYTPAPESESCTQIILESKRGKFHYDPFSKTR